MSQKDYQIIKRKALKKIINNRKFAPYCVKPTISFV